MSHKGQDELADLLKQATENVAVGGRYYHYKDPTRHYRVVETVIIEADEGVGVIYQALYGRQLTFMRPLADFLATVMHNGAQTPRFTRIDET